MLVDGTVRYVLLKHGTNYTLITSCSSKFHTEIFSLAALNKLETYQKTLYFTNKFLYIVLSDILYWLLSEAPAE
jgi:hypothetical protein